MGEYVMPRGIIRRIDDLGRITLPSEYRLTGRLVPGLKVDMRLEGQVICLRLGQADFVGIKRPIDGLGRVTIPKEYRRSLHFADRELVDIYIVDDDICIKKEMLQCVFCESDNEDKLIVRNGVHVCEECIAEMAGSIDRSVDRECSEQSKVLQ
jgi:bifunctional DNA-binding transcriptional regulator/antitoxin component of YhaV-PrlF toxin-antitoxin module